jgi:PAS domain S-box-containing protein
LHGKRKTENGKPKMAASHPSPEDLLAEIADLRSRLEEAEDTLRAIRAGEVDALVVSGLAGEQIYSLKGADYSYRILVEAINEGAGILALDGDILFANQQMAGTLGAPLERLIGTCIYDYVEAADRELVMALLEHGRQGGSKGEVSLRNRHGVIVPAYLSFRSFNLEEAPGAVCVVVTDLTQQKRQEAILAEELLSRAIFEQAEAVILVVDPTGRILRASHEAHQICRDNLLLRQFDEVLRLEIFDETSGKSGPAAYKPFFSSAILQGKIYRGLEVSFSPPDGREPLEMLLNAGPLLGSQGEVMAAVVTLTDITERKKAEEALKRAHDELEQKIKERTAELRQMVTQLQEEVAKRRQTEESLQESKERLRHLPSQLLAAQEVERGRLARELHDDLGQSLAVLKMQLRAIQRKAPPESSETRESLEHSLNFINEIVEKIRRLSRNLRPAILEGLQLGEALQNMFDDFATHYEVKDFLVNLDRVETLIPPETQLHIYRIFQEALNNIAKYAHPTKVMVNMEKEARGVSIRIEDDGEGFDPEEVMARKAWEKGMGLATMSERVAMLGGKFHIKSKKGQGTRITFALPLK